MYNIIQLNDKELSELQSIAKELGIKNAESMMKDELVYGILDEQAIAGASKRAAKNAAKEAQPRKRSRISITNVKFHSSQVLNLLRTQISQLLTNYQQSQQHIIAKLK